MNARRTNAMLENIGQSLALAERSPIPHAQVQAAKNFLHQLGKMGHDAGGKFKSMVREATKYAELMRSLGYEDAEKDWLGIVTIIQRIGTLLDNLDQSAYAAQVPAESRRAPKGKKVAEAAPKRR